MKMEVNKHNLEKGDITLELDFSTVNNLEEMHSLLMAKFGFPDFYGKNVNALIDCLTSLRFPEDEMTKVVLGMDAVLNLVVVGLSKKTQVIINSFLVSVETVNNRYMDKGYKPCIRLVLY